MRLTLGVVAFPFLRDQCCAACFRIGRWRYGWRMHGSTTNEPTPLCDGCAAQRNNGVLP